MDRHCAPVHHRRKDNKVSGEDSLNFLNFPGGFSASESVKQIRDSNNHMHLASAPPLSYVRGLAPKMKQVAVLYSKQARYIGIQD